MIPLPRVAIVGRPNVGKSTLFNRICGMRKAITDGQPGSTRDRNYAQTSWQGSAFELIDTGGLLLESDDPLLGPASKQAERAIEEADLVLFIVDVRAGLLPDDVEISKSIRKTGKPVIVVANKAERTNADLREFDRLGYDEGATISAEHGQGIGDLLDRVIACVTRVAPEETSEPTLRIALVGRPNVGKSSILNRMIGNERALVSDVPGTTRDVVDTRFDFEGRRCLLLDTAGIRRSKALKTQVDHVSVVQARHAVERADVVILVVDADTGPREMDATIAGYAHEAGRGLILCINKWDLVKERALDKDEVIQTFHDQLKFLTHAPVLCVSALKGQGVGRILRTAVQVVDATKQRITTGQLNRLLAELTAKHHPKATVGSQPVNILYGTQIGIRPPTFLLMVNRETDLHFSYKRYIENNLRKEYGFQGAPIVIKVKARKRKRR